MSTLRHRPAVRWILGGAVAALLVATAVVVVAVVNGDGPADPPRPGGTRTLAVGDRPVTVHLPPAYDGTTGLPLVILLHGYTSSGAEQERYFRIRPEADRRGFVYATPDGTGDRRNNRFWNATDACCDFDGSGVDDSRYLREVIDTIRAEYRVDARRVYLIGHSNGAFMAFRMACDHAGTVTAIATLNGATWNDVRRCAPASPVGVLAVHGTADRTILFGGGGDAARAYPSAERTAADWAALNGCGGPAAGAPAIDVVDDLPGAETAVREVATACRGGTAVRTWTIAGGVHVPDLGPAFTPAMLDFLLARAAA